MRSRLVFLVLALTFLVAAPASAVNFNLNLILGQKKPSSGGLMGDGTLTRFGAMIDIIPGGWPAGVALDISGETKKVKTNGIKTWRSAREVDLGARKYWGEAGELRPYAGGGLAVVTAEQEREGGFLTTISEDEATGLGVWLNTGALYTIKGHWNVGLDLRWTWARVELMDESRDAGGVQAGVLLGYGW